MKAVERENEQYGYGKRETLSKAEETLFSFLGRSKLKILDIGCGTGYVALVNKNNGHDVKGIDFSSVAVQQAVDLGIDCQVIDLDNGIPFEDNSFDVVWAGDVIEHVFDPIFLMKEVRRVLVEGGRLLCSFPYDLNLMNRLRVASGHSPHETLYKKYGQIKHHTFVSLPLIKYLLKDFTIKETRYLVKIPKVRDSYVTKSKLLLYFTYTIMIKAVACPGWMKK